MATTIHLQAPPLVTHQRYAVGERALPTRRFCLWRHNAALDLHLQSLPAFPAGTAVGIAIKVACTPRRDLHTVGSILLDLLYERGVIGDEAPIGDLRVMADKSVESGRVLIEAMPLGTRRAS